MIYKAAERVVEIFEEGGHDAIEALEQKLFDMRGERHFPSPLDWQMHNLVSSERSGSHINRGIVTSDWYLEGPIRFLYMPGTPDDYVQAALAGTKEIVNEIGLDLEILPEEYDPISPYYKQLSANPVLSMEAVFDFIRRDLTEGQQKRASPGIVFVANKPTATDGLRFVPDYASDDGEDTPYGHLTHGQGTFSGGSAFLDVSEETMQRVTEGDPLEEIRVLAKHEVGHMLGIGHHEELQVDGYEEWTRCLMRALNLEGNEVYSLCDKCKDGAQALWYGLGLQTERRFLKDE